MSVRTTAADTTNLLQKPRALLVASATVPPRQQETLPDAHSAWQLLSRTPRWRSQKAPCTVQSKRSGIPHLPSWKGQTKWHAEQAARREIPLPAPAPV